MEHRVEERTLLGELLGDLTEHIDNHGPRRTLHHDHGIVVFTKLGEILDPKPVVFALWIEEIDTADLVAQVLLRQQAGHASGNHSNRDHRCWCFQAEPRPGDKQTGDAALAADRLAAATTARIHAIRRHLRFVPHEDSSHRCLRRSG